MDRNRRVGQGEGEPQQVQRTAQQDQRGSRALVLWDEQRQEIGSQQEQGGQIAAAHPACIQDGRQRRLKICLLAALHGYKYVGQQPVVAFLDGYWHSWNMAAVRSPHPWHQFRPSIDTMRKQSRRGMVLQWARTYAKEALQIIFEGRPAAELAFVLARLNAHN
ncbi:hypothetical protein LTR56_019405 [Elasticomyces elasticus]|nr:hypothetical protein LTR22_023431 [Elasticomyces elasticus]KAK3627081.1 hypothetical protein LTR56_019405 [Elasticomyces elasticus]KAK4904711.1 hypothetical protein LTR49_025882 [Elasticomyces elasticus]KAK5746519.1 hypothetical protein LTS12_022702 [Elasticomyces elasticus]